MVVSADGVYSETLQSIIDAKLVELVRKRDAFESSKAKVIETVSNQNNGIDQLRALLEGVKHCFKIETGQDGQLYGPGTRILELTRQLQNLERFIQQPRYDQSLSPILLEDWKSSLMRPLDAQSARYEYASLYAKLVTEWLSSEKGMKPASADGDLVMAESSEELDSAAKIESRSNWEDSVFKPFETRTDDIRSFLSTLFGEDDRNKKPISKALQLLRDGVKAFEQQLTTSVPFNDSVIRWAVNGLLSGELLSEEKRVVLRDFLNNSVILAELSDVLNLRMANIDQWSWGDAIAVDQRRRVAGHFSMHMHEDLLQAIFLQYVGTKWAVFFRRAFCSFIDTSGVWMHAADDVPANELKRRQYYMGKQFTKSSLQTERHRLWRSKYFLTQLPKSEWQQLSATEGDEEADFAALTQQSRPGVMAVQAMQSTQRSRSAAQAPRKQLASKAARRSAPTDEESESGFLLVDDDEYGHGEDSYEDYGDNDFAAQDLMNMKQGLLHLLQSEILINTRLHGGLTAVRSQFENWNALLPHSTVLVVLAYLGVSPKWQKFVQTFLQAPLGFMQDGKIDSPRTRQRGVPGSHPLSDILGEIVLFCMDFFVNQECKGTKLWRMNDDFWFWSPDVNVCTQTWSSIKRFTDLFGLDLDSNKAGSAIISKKSSNTVRSDELPKNHIRWGFLYLDSTSGQFEIDQSLVDHNISQLKRQLEGKMSKGVLSWIQAWNAYAINFFSTNFGKPANCFGAAHIDKILSTLQRMQSEVFNNSNVVKFLKANLRGHTHVDDIPEGYFFFPMEMGGLDVRNPFVNPLQLAAPVSIANPDSFLDKWEQAEREVYENLKKKFEKRIANGQINGRGRGPTGRNFDYQPSGEDAHTFFSFEEYSRHREVFNEEFQGNGYGGLTLTDTLKTYLKQPSEQKIALSPEIRLALEQVDRSGVVAQCGITNHQQTMTGYWTWVTQVYGPEIISKFGGLHIVDNGVLPIGMVSLVRSERIQWN